MKKLSNTLKYIVIIASLTAGNAIADETTHSYGFKKLSADLCHAAVLPQSAKFRSSLRAARTNLRNIYLSVDCNGQSLLEVAELNQAVDVAKYIRNKTIGLNKEELAKVALQ